MGCNNSRMVKVAPTGQSTDNKTVVQSESQDRKSSMSGSKHSLDTSSDRGGSASSKGSKHSTDSGFQQVSDDEYANIITENSDERVVADLENRFKPNEELDLCLNGAPAPRNLSAKDKARLDEQRILENLRNEGLITTSKHQARSGLAFEVIEEGMPLKRAKPARLAKLEKKKKKKKALTQEDIQAKLEKAEQRRKEAEAERLEKINSVTTKSAINTALDSFMHHQEEIKEQSQVKVDIAAEKREQKLRELKEKLKAKEEHAAKVRLRKKLHIPTQEEMDELDNQSKEAAASLTTTS